MPPATRFLLKRIVDRERPFGGLRPPGSVRLDKDPAIATFLRPAPTTIGVDFRATPAMLRTAGKDYAEHLLDSGVFRDHHVDRPFMEKIFNAEPYSNMGSEPLTELAGVAAADAPVAASAPARQHEPGDVVRSALGLEPGVAVPVPPAEPQAEPPVEPVVPDSSDDDEPPSPMLESASVPGQTINPKVRQLKVAHIPGAEVETAGERPERVVYVDRFVDRVVPGPERVKYREVPGPERVINVPGPERVIYVDREVPRDVPGPVIEKPGPERVVYRYIDRATNEEIPAPPAPPSFASQALQAAAGGAGMAAKAAAAVPGAVASGIYQGVRALGSAVQSGVSAALTRTPEEETPGEPGKPPEKMTPSTPRPRASSPKRAAAAPAAPAAPAVASLLPTEAQFMAQLNAELPIISKMEKGQHSHLVKLIKNANQFRPKGEKLDPKQNSGYLYSELHRMANKDRPEYN